MLHLQKIHHVAIIVSDYERSKRFYAQTLGLTVIRETYRAARDSYKLDLSVNGHDQIELFSFPHPPARPSYPEATGLRPALVVEDIDEAQQALDRASCGKDNTNGRYHRPTIYVFCRPRRPAN